MALREQLCELRLGSHEPAPVQFELVVGSALAPQRQALLDEPVDLGPERLNGVLNGIHSDGKVRPLSENPL